MSEHHAATAVGIDGRLQWLTYLFVFDLCACCFVVPAEGSLH
jgi:hypothetical protein